MSANDILGLKRISDEIELELNKFIKLFLILYADDTALLAESEKDLQRQLNALHDYCLTWKLKVNVDKAKSLFFHRED